MSYGTYYEENLLFGFYCPLHSPQEKTRLFTEQKWTAYNVLFDTNFQSGSVLAEHDCTNFVSGTEKLPTHWVSWDRPIGRLWDCAAMFGVCHRNTHTKKKITMWCFKNGPDHFGAGKNSDADKPLELLTHLQCLQVPIWNSVCHLSYLPFI